MSAFPYLFEGFTIPSNPGLTPVPDLRYVSMDRLHFDRD